MELVEQKSEILSGYIDFPRILQHIETKPPVVISSLYFLVRCQSKELQDQQQDDNRWLAEPQWHNPGSIVCQGEPSPINKLNSKDEND